MKPTYEELEARCEALAAENAGLKSCAEFYSAGFRAEQAKGSFGLEWKPTEQLLDDCGNIASDALKTLATDAFLAEVRASGVDIFGDYLNGLGWHEADIKQVRQFAAQLRKGDAQ